MPAMFNAENREMTSFVTELQSLLRLITRYHQVLGVVVVATVLMVLVQSQAIPWIAKSEHQSVVFYGLIPLAVLALIYRLPVSQWQLGLGDVAFWLPASALYVVVALPLVVIGSQGVAMDAYYQQGVFKWGDYLTYALVYLLGWEYFFRGFLLAGLREHLKEAAILVQAIPFTLLHLGKPNVETLSCIFSGLVWGYICYRGRSFWPAFIMHAVVNIATVWVVNH
jgi:membrane protease YdiL (CAAX protease family)